MSTYEVASRAARRALYAETQPGPVVLIAVSREARDLADGVARQHWSKIVDMLEAGRTFRVKSYPATFATGGEDVELIAAIEEVFE